jgi:predicted Rdx family selenoprotein
LRGQIFDVKKSEDRVWEKRKKENFPEKHAKALKVDYI